MGLCNWLTSLFGGGSNDGFHPVLDVDRLLDHGEPDESRLDAAQNLGRHRLGAETEEVVHVLVRVAGDETEPDFLRSSCTRSLLHDELIAEIRGASRSH